MRIFYLSTVSPFDLNSWSGITYHTYHSLATEHELFWSGKPIFRYWEKKVQSWTGWWRRLKNQRYTDQTLHHSRILSAWAARELQKHKVDIIVIGSGEPEAFAFLQTDLPIVYIADSTFSLKTGYYPWHTGLSEKFLKQGEQVETRAIGLASHILYSSAWAAHSAVNDYHAPWSKLSVLPFGPNLRNIPSELSKPEGYVLRLLFIGTNWKRKGGDEAVEVYKILKRSYECELVIIGSNPELDQDEGIRVIPFLDKNGSEDEWKYKNYLACAHFLVLPTRADCTPIVISEAAAYGLPVISYDTGGVSELVQDNITGICLPVGSGPQKLADKISELWINKQKYLEMKAAIRRDYETRLNWHHWLQRANEVFFRLLKYEKESSHYQF